MTVGELMTRSPVCCGATTPLPEVARMMVAANCGCIPVVNEHHHPIGVVTDRDIVCRTIACDRDALELTAEDCMTEDCVVVTPEATVEYCCKLLEQDQIRRAVVVDTMGRVCGIVAQADLARHSVGLAGRVVAAVSKPSRAPSSVR
jgi:CBS domain-containing protein